MFKYNNIFDLDTDKYNTKLSIYKILYFIMVHNLNKFTYHENIHH